MLLYSPCPLQLRDGKKKAGGKEHLTALLAAAISSNTSLMSEAVKPELWFLFENTTMICMFLEHDMVVSTVFLVFQQQQNRTSGTPSWDCLSLKTVV